MVVVAVGIDGSPASDEALRFAIGEAERRNATLRVVCGWHAPPMTYAGGYPPPGLEKELAEQAQRTIDEALARTNGNQRGIEIESVFPRGQTAEVLLDEGRKADLLVVGSRGRGGFSSLLLGSTSLQVVQHATCPVIVVRSPQAATPA